MLFSEILGKLVEIVSLTHADLPISSIPQVEVQPEQQFGLLLRLQCILLDRTSIRSLRKLLVLQVERVLQLRANRLSAFQNLHRRWSVQVEGTLPKLRQERLPTVNGLILHAQLHLLLLDAFQCVEVWVRRVANQQVHV